MNEDKICPLLDDVDAFVDCKKEDVPGMTTKTINVF